MIFSVRVPFRLVLAAQRLFLSPKPNISSPALSTRFDVIAWAPITPTKMAKWQPHIDGLKRAIVRQMGAYQVDVGRLNWSGSYPPQFMTLSPSVKRARSGPAAIDPLAAILGSCNLAIYGRN